MPLTSTRRERPFSALFVALAIALLLLAGVLTGTTRSHAAIDGSMVSYGGWTVGTRQLESGEFVYCVEPGALTPSGAQLGPQEVEELRGYSFATFDATGWSGVTSSDPISGEALRRINYVISEYGATTDAAEATAVQFAVWMLRGAPGEAAWLAHHTAWVENHGGVAEIARARVLAEEARAAARPPAAPSAPGALRLELDEPLGTGTLEYPVGTVELRVTGAVFADGSDRFVPSSGTAGTVTWQAQPHRDGWRSTHEVRASGSWQIDGTGWPARLKIFPAVLSDQQTLAWAVGPAVERGAGEFTEVVEWIDQTFEPVLSTRVAQQVLGQNDRFADTVSLGVHAGSAPWPSRTTVDGAVEWAPLTLDGVLYGPFATAQPISAEPPEGAPVARRLRLIADRGPADYSATAEEPPTESGYYYWVWTIAAQTQAGTESDANLLPDGYRFTDAFGLPEELHVVTMPTPPATVPEDPAETDPTGLARTGANGESRRNASLMGLGAIALGAGTLLASGAMRWKGRDMQRPRSPRR